MMDLKINDKLICKKSNGVFIENQLYTINSIFSYSTLNVTLPVNFWRKKELNKDYLAPEHFYLITIENVQISGTLYDVYELFYTKKEARKLKLEKLNESR